MSKRLKTYPLVAILTLIFISSATLQATNQQQTAKPQKPSGPQAMTILQQSQLPHPEAFLPQPAEIGSAAFCSDYAKHLEGKALRNTERGATAIADAKVSAEYYLQRFSEAVGRQLTVADYPTLAQYVQTVQVTVRKSINSTKNVFHRRRPYDALDEPSAIPRHEKKGDLTSYPSGHSIRAWGVAMALVAIAPEHQDAILRTGYEMCRSRVIAGYHWQTDIEAGMIAASAAYARLCFEPAFLQLQSDARAEFNARQ